MTAAYVIYILIGVAIGAFALWLFMERRLRAVEAASGKKDIELAVRQEQLSASDSRISHLESAIRQQSDLSEAKADENKQLHARCEALSRELELLRQQMADEVKRHESHFSNMAQQLLEQSARKLKEQNQESMTAITQPLRDQLTEMRRVLGDTSKGHTEETASLREQLRLMMEQTARIGEKAESLTNVLRRDNKLSGNMGEIILGDLLASQGLTEGIHYEVQTRLRDAQGRPLKHDETGAELQPDVILHYPQGQDAIIDSKVSLVAYERYVNARTPEERDHHLQDHIKSVRHHVSELARKDYSKYIQNGRDAVDFVIMFVPFESSLQLALANDPTLWRDAFEKKVFITGEQNLLGILHMIHLAWVQNQQAENQQRVFGMAEQLIDRLGDFIQRYYRLGEQLQKAQEAYDSAGNKLVSGRQSVVQKGRELVDLGAKENPNRRLPRELPSDAAESNS